MDTPPDELLLYVLGYSEAGSLWALSLVNKRLANIVKPHLYERYFFDRGHPELLLRSVAASPELGTLINSVDWDNQSSGAYSHAHYLLSLREERYVLRRIRQCSPSLSIASPTRPTIPIYPWEPQKYPSIDPYLAVILLLTPRLEELRIAHFSGWSCNQGWLDVPLAKLTPLSNLKKLSIIGFIGYKFDIVPFLMLPSLRTVEVEDAMYIIFEYEGHNSQAKSLVEHFRLVGQSPQPLQIAVFARSVQHLKTFSIRYRSTGAPFTTEHFTALTHLLFNARQSLERVSLRQWESPIGFETVLKAACFRDATKLRTLELTIPVVSKPNQLPLTFQSLPSRLDTLVMRLENCLCDNLAATLRTIAHNIHAWVPNLKTLILIGWDKYQRSFLCQADLVALRTVFAKHGILFVSQPYESEYADIFALDYAEPDWSWILPMRILESQAEKEWRWVVYIQGVVYDVDACSFHMEDDGDWVRIDTWDEDGFPCVADTIVDDQYLTEQPVWYWNELQSRRISA